MAEQGGSSSQEGTCPEEGTCIIQGDPFFLGMLTAIARGLVEDVRMATFSSTTDAEAFLVSAFRKHIGSVLAMGRSHMESFPESFPEEDRRTMLGLLHCYLNQLFHEVIQKVVGMETAPRGEEIVGHIKSCCQEVSKICILQVHLIKQFLDLYREREKKRREEEKKSGDVIE